MGNYITVRRGLLSVACAATTLLLLTQSATAVGALDPRSSTASTTVAHSTESGAVLEAQRTGRRVEVTDQRAAGRTVFANPDGTLTAELTMGTAGVPSPTAPGLKGWAQVFEGYPDRSYWNGDGDGVAKVGECWNGDGECNGIGTSRAYFQYETGWLNGRIIIGAGFRPLVVHSATCTPTEFKAVGTTPISPSTRWEDLPTPVYDLGTRNMAAGGRSCPEPKYAEFDATDIVAWSTTPSRNVSTTNIMLRARYENDQNAWKKFAVNPVLSVTYNTRPNVPSDLQVENGKRCGTGANEVRVNPQLSDPTTRRGPILSAAVSDADRGTVTARFRVYERDRTTPVHSADATGVNSPGRVSVELPAQYVANDRKLSWKAVGYDGRDESVPHSGWCDVTIDLQAPNGEPTISSPTYVDCGDKPDCAPSGAVGFTGGFTLIPDTEDTDVAGFVYSLIGGDDDQPSTKDVFVPVASDGAAHILVTPAEDGLQTLIAKARDKAGNLSAVSKSFRFFVGYGTAPEARWRLNGLGSATAVVDDQIGHLDGVRPAGAATNWRPGRYGDALWFDGSTAAAVTAGNRPALDTGKSFSVSAWVKLDQTGNVFRTAVSQSAATISGYFLQYNGNTGRWNFVLPASDADAAARHVAASATPAVAGRWTHLVGVFDDASKSVKLYVDGHAGTTGSHPNPWKASGPTQLGRGQVQNKVVNNWLGSIDEVRLYQRVLNPAEVGTLAGSPVSEELFWPLDEAGGTTIVDASGNYRLGGLPAGATRTQGAIGSGAVRLDGSGASIATDTPVLRTDAGFTVSARVKLDAVDLVSRTILSQDSGANSAFRLEYDGERRRWSFVVRQPDGQETSISSDEVPTTAWTQLTAVYDHAAGRLHLYVDGEVATYSLAQVRVFTAPSGPVRVGAARQAGETSAPFLGEVDDIHAWSGVLTPQQVRNQYSAQAVDRPQIHSGQIARFETSDGTRIVTNGPVPPAAHFERSLGVPAPAGTPNTRTIHSCRRAADDYFLSPTCGEFATLGTVGQFWTSAPTGMASLEIFRCFEAAVGRHFASTDPDCEGATPEFSLGFTRAEAALVRHLSSRSPYDHVSSTGPLPADQQAEYPLGYLAMTQTSGTSAWMQCRNGEDTFSSTDPGCEGHTVLGSSGYVWIDPPQGRHSIAVYRCRTPWNDLFDSTHANCEDSKYTVDRLLGYAIAHP